MKVVGHKSCRPNICTRALYEMTLTSKYTPFAIRFAHCSLRGGSRRTSNRNTTNVDMSYDIDNDDEDEGSVWEEEDSEDRLPINSGSSRKHRSERGRRYLGGEMRREKTLSVLIPPPL